MTWQRESQSIPRSFALQVDSFPPGFHGSECLHTFTTRLLFLTNSQYAPSYSFLRISLLTTQKVKSLDSLGSPIPTSYYKFKVTCRQACEKINWVCPGVYFMFHLRPTNNFHHLEFCPVCGAGLSTFLHFLFTERVRQRERERGGGGGGGAWVNARGL